MMKIYSLCNKHDKIFKVTDNYNVLSPRQKDKLLNVKCRIDTVPTKEWEISKKVLNQYEYIYTSSRTNKNICGIIPVSRSYFKLYEILKDTIGIPSEGKAGCIAEGPGGFIHCLNDHSNIIIHGITLISRIDRKITYWNLQIINNERNFLSYGIDGTGDIYKIENAEKYINETIKDKVFCDLVTADGGFDYSKDYNLQESASYQLIYSEIYINLSIQKEGGTFIIKVFDLFDYKTIQLLYLLYISYDKILLHKPLTSRLSNSEKYVVCIGYNKYNGDLLDVLKEYYDHCGDLIIDVPDSFINDIIKYNESFIDNQINTINDIIINIQSENKLRPSKKQINDAIQWCKSYDLPLNKKCIYKA